MSLGVFNLPPMIRHFEFHRSHRIGWLRAAVMGANDGIVSTASLIIGIAAAHTSHSTILLTGVAGLVSGAMSMAAGEYVSVSSQSDTENADLARERNELATEPEHELNELQGIYVNRGLTPDLALQVALQLTAHDALGAHARDELGISEIMNARPVQAALASAGTFAIGAALPLLVALVAPELQLIPYVAIMSLAFLAVLGALAAKTGGANIWLGTARVAFWGVLAMAATAAVGSLFGVAAA
jgi:VIT1/CCC1 family predicted Fe2+/Mn2+ transporter